MELSEIEKRYEEIISGEVKPIEITQEMLDDLNKGMGIIWTIQFNFWRLYYKIIDGWDK